MNQISIATSMQEISDCFPVMSELRPHLSQAEFITQVRRQQEQCHYRLGYLQADESIEAVAGFRLSESLAWGKFLYVDDLVTRSVRVAFALRNRRSNGYGSILFNWLLEYARSNGCQQLALDSGVQRFAAHRFYLQQRMEITSHHFTLKL
jgi:GNAT superfamily N-acetyltransferase